MMTRQHFVRLAAAVRGIQDDTSRDVACAAIGTVCAESNSRFDWDRWNAACHPVDTSIDCNL